MSGATAPVDWVTTVLTSGVVAAVISAVGVWIQQSRLTRLKAKLDADLERTKSGLTASAAKKQRLETLQQDAIFELYAEFREAVYTAEHFSKASAGQGFKSMVGGHSADYLIGNDWGKAYRKLDEKGLLFRSTLVTAMRDVLEAIENIQRAVRDGNEPYSFEEPTSAARDRNAAWVTAANLVTEELHPKWKKVTDEFQVTLGIGVDLGEERPA